MKNMENKSVDARHHDWAVSAKEARSIQENLRELWQSSDRLGKIRTLAGLDAAFVLTGTQALCKRAGHWNQRRGANRAIAGVVVFRFPEMQEISRGFAIVQLEFP
jgi:deoxyinosine 3'endonuclease (endonuclease V)